MAGGAASETILFIGSMVAATLVVGVLGVAVQDVSGGMRNRGDALSKELSTDVSIINDPLAMTTAPLTVYAKNTGGSLLTVSLTDLFLDGTPSSSPSFDVLGTADDDIWRPGDVLKITAGDVVLPFSPMAVGDHRVRVVTENGIQDELLFYKA